MRISSVKFARAVMAAGGTHSYLNSQEHKVTLNLTSRGLTITTEVQVPRDNLASWVLSPPKPLVLPVSISLALGSVAGALAAWGLL